jgi:hypothetical protein
MYWIIAAGILVVGGFVVALVWPRGQRPLRTVADPAAAGETAAHRTEIAAPNALAPVDPSETEGWRITTPNGTSSGERWRTRPAAPVAPVVVPEPRREQREDQQPAAVAIATGGSNYNMPYQAVGLDLAMALLNDRDKSAKMEELLTQVVEGQAAQTNAISDLAAAQKATAEALKKQPTKAAAPRRTT